MATGPLKRKSSIGNGERSAAGNECLMIRRSRLLCSREEQLQAANDRSEPGHWEADTVAGKTGSSCLMTLTCRKSRLLLSLKIPRKTSAHVRDGRICLLGALSPEPVRSITPDRGKEFAKKRRNLRCAGQRPFFSSASRGMNESTNGLIREYCPKSTDLECFDPAFFTAFASKMSVCRWRLTVTERLTFLTV